MSDPADNHLKECPDCGELMKTHWEYGCQACCDHEFDPDEGFMCLNCGKEGAETVMADAYDRAKNIRKYGG